MIFNPNWLRPGAIVPVTPEVVALLVQELRSVLSQLDEREEAPWLTKSLMADYLDLIAEAIEDNRSEMLRHKAHWMRVRGEA